MVLDYFTLYLYVTESFFCLNVNHYETNTMSESRIFNEIRAGIKFGTRCKFKRFLPLKDDTDSGRTDLVIWKCRGENNSEDQSIILTFKDACHNTHDGVYVYNFITDDEVIYSFEFAEEDPDIINKLSKFIDFNIGN